MGDIALHLSTDTDLHSVDMRLVADDVEADEGLRTAVLLSLFTDRRAEADDALPGNDSDRRGWWADEFAEVEGDKIGSRMWLLDRSKRTSDVAADAERFAQEALSWMVDDLVLERVDVESSNDELSIVLHRPDADPTKFRFAHAWAGEEAR